MTAAQYVVTITNRLPQQAGMPQQRATLVVGPFTEDDARLWLGRYRAAHPGRGGDATTQPDLGIWPLTAPFRMEDHA